MGYVRHPSLDDAREWGRVQAESAPADSEEQIRRLSNLLGLRLFVAANARRDVEDDS